MERVIHEDEARTVTETTTEGWPDRQGSTRSLVTAWKAGHEPVREPTAEDRIAALEAEVRAIRTAAAAEADKADPTAKGVAQAVAGADTGTE